MDINLSIIVPVYNVEDYIIECVKSLLEVPIEKKEIIIINDGSTDSSINKLLELNSSCIKIINQKNSGLSAARNTGLNNAKGEYILFIDSDDFIINSQSIAEMLYTAQKNNLDVITGNGYVYYSQYNKYPIFKDMDNLDNLLMDGKMFLKESIQRKSFKAMVWLNIYKNSFIKDNNFEFLQGYYHEDIDWTVKIMLKAEKVIYINKLFYMYRQRDGSIMQSKDYTKNAKDMIEICLNNIRLIDMEKDEDLKTLICDEMLDTIFWVIMKAQKSNCNFMYSISINEIPYKKSGNAKTKLKFCLFKRNKYIAYWLNNVYEKLKS